MHSGIMESTGAFFSPLTASVTRQVGVIYSQIRHASRPSNMGQVNDCTKGSLPREKGDDAN